MSLDDFVFTTEAHPLRKLRTQNDVSDSDTIPFCVLTCRPPTPVPWTIMCIGIAIVLVIAFVLWVIVRRIIIALVVDKTKTL